jgi:hypothetical protein
MKKAKQPDSPREDFLRRLSEGGNMMRKPGELPPPYERACVQPTVYELAQLAIALRGGAAAEKPKEAVQCAMNVWRAAGREIHHLIARHLLITVHGVNPDQPPQPRGIEFHMAELDGTPIICNEAWEWVNSALPPYLRFNKYRSFHKAWDAYEECNRHYHFVASINDLRQFVDSRIKEGRAKAAAKQQTKRAKKKTTNPPSNKIARRHPPKTKGTKR